MVNKRPVLAAFGILSVAMGTLGIFLPLLPTTPFLLLAGWLFAKSSPRRHTWLLNHPHLGPYIHAFRGKRGLTRTQKWRMGSSFTVLIGISAYFAPLTSVRAMLAGLWLFWVVFLLRVRSADASEGSNAWTNRYGTGARGPKATSSSAPRPDAFG